MLETTVGKKKEQQQKKDMCNMSGVCYYCG